jgi:hypothetical protein
VPQRFEWDNGYPKFSVESGWGLTDTGNNEEPK